MKISEESKDGLIVLVVFLALGVFGLVCVLVPVDYILSAIGGLIALGGVYNVCYMIYIAWTGKQAF
ncbi:hypothetical protein [Dysgonomonas capnocytophagoides]|uniref:hypothetical protein n=1 Tax=Dysgonomonas capnocytophagoides TaxID=45254 RepID=UPI002A814530|nr:hypothetical protein [Dysgonomonas capnocytophagoides]